MDPETILARVRSRLAEVDPLLDTADPLKTPPPAHTGATAQDAAPAAAAPPPSADFRPLAEIGRAWRRSDGIVASEASTVTHTGPRRARCLLAVDAPL